MEFDKSENKEPGFNSEIPVCFSSLEEARNSLDYNWNWVMGLLHKLSVKGEDNAPIFEPESPVVREATLYLLQETFRKWDDAFELFLEHAGKTLDIKSLQGALALKIRKRSSMASFEYLTSRPSDDSMIWDKSLPIFEEIVSLATSIVLAPSECGTVSIGTDPSFSLDGSIVVPLFMVARSCRHPIIRRKAIALLGHSKRQEGLWEGTLTARVLNRAVEIEEEGLGEVLSCEDVPAWARISNIDVQFDPDGRKACMTYNRQRSELEEKMETIKETIVW
jgi:hypothetical protein